MSHYEEVEACIEAVLDNSQVDVTIRHTGDDLALEIERRIVIPVVWLFDEEVDKADEFLDEHKRLGADRVLAATYFPTKLATKFRKQGIQYMDLQGNAFISNPRVHIVIVGRRPANYVANQPNSVTGKAFQPAGLKVVFALLTNKGLERASQREIADKAGVSLGSVSAIHKDLVAQGFLKQIGKNYELRDKEKLINKWAETYPYMIRNKTHLGAFTANEPDWWINLIEGQGFQLGGEIAAYHYSQYLNPKDGIAYATTEGFPKLMQAGRLRKIKEGEQPNIVIDVYEPFWKDDEMNADIATHWLIAYSDLLATNDPRNIDAAKRLYDEHHH